VRFFQSIAGVWQWTDYTYTEAGVLVPAVINTPTPGTALSGSVNFDWSGGSGPAQYQLLVGTSGVGSDDLYMTGSTTATSATVSIPANGVTVYARLAQLIDGAWQHTDYVYTESGQLVLAAINSPSPSGVLSGSTETFDWSGGVGPVSYQLLVGTTGVGSDNIFYQANTTATSATVTTLPVNGETVFVRLNQLVDGVWKSTDYNYTESGTLVSAAITSPAAGSTLTGTSVTFSWPGGAGPAGYQLLVGTTGVGSNNLYYSGVTTATSETLNVPAYGVTLFVRLRQEIDGAWQSTDYTYTESGSPTPAVLTAPTTGNLLSGPVTFTWTTGNGPTSYQLLVGTFGVGTDNIYISGSTTLTSESVTIPANGVTVYVRLNQLINGVWQATDYVYTEAGTTVPATLTPASGILSAPVTFSWANGAGPASYQLLVGSTGVGSDNLLMTGSTTATSATLTTLPASGKMVYARLNQRINGVWVSTDYTYTVQ
jgi:hypothetical protein